MWVCLPCMPNEMSLYVDLPGSLSQNSSLHCFQPTNHFTRDFGIYSYWDPKKSKLEILYMISRRAEEMMCCWKNLTLRAQECKFLFDFYNFLSLWLLANYITSVGLSLPIHLGRKAMTNPDSILKSRDIILPTKVHLVKAVVFPAVMYGCEIKKAEPWRIDAFELSCWRRLLRVPWTAKRSNQSILKEISLSVHWKDWCRNWNSNTLATWCEELIHLKRLWERLQAGGKGHDRGWDGWMASLTQWRWVWVNYGSWWWTGRPGVLQSMGLQTVRYDWVTELNWKYVNNK